MSERESHRTEPSERREFTTEEALEIESDRRRRVVAAFLRGGDARPDGPALRPWRGIAGGMGLAAAIVVLVGVVGVASATLAAGGAGRPSPSPTPSPSVSAAPHPGAGLAPTTNRPSPTP